MDSEVKHYYDTNAEHEWERLNNPYTNIEYQTTLHLINRYFPKTGSLLDIGSGPGRYSLALLKQGYRVSLLDLSINELELAKQKIEEARLKAEQYYCMSALDLNQLPSESFDGILLMGPLYHLHQDEERQKVLRETKRILKPNGAALISYINTLGVLKASVTEFPESFEDIHHFDRYLHGNLIFTPESSFTATFFTTPSLALDEINRAGFKVISYAGAESFLSGLYDPIIKLYQTMPTVYENYIQKAMEYCELPPYRDATEHLHVIVRKCSIRHRKV
jgi:2-polyprenyl-3-methyl-5-hydroxy-6-metoxy-1,4-benzoquinol methylase